MSETSYPTEGPDGTIPVNTGKTWAQNWATYQTASDNEFVTTYFEIPIVDFKNILKYNEDAESVRAYIGLTDAEDPTTAKLVLVPVVDGHDVVIVPTDPILGLGDENQSNVYDMTNSCPPTCGPSESSFLNY